MFSRKLAQKLFQKKEKAANGLVIRDHFAETPALLMDFLSAHDKFTSR